VKSTQQRESYRKFVIIDIFGKQGLLLGVVNHSPLIKGYDN